MTAQNSETINSKFSSPLQVCLNERYHLKTPLDQHGHYTLFRGIDVKDFKWVHVYARSSNSHQTKTIRQNIRNQFCPKVLWSGTVPAKPNTYFQVHQKYGPSLNSMFQKIKKVPKEQQILHLLYEMIKLVEKMNNASIFCGQLDPDYIILDPSPAKTELYLLNCFRIKKKKQGSKVTRSRYSSRGAHLGRDTNIKDDLESVCYILIDIFLEGNFLYGKNISQYQEIKLSMKVQEFAPGIPSTLAQFYHYIVSLNTNDDINFFSWKSILSKRLTPKVLTQPYAFLQQLSLKASSLLADQSLSLPKGVLRAEEEEDPFELEEQSTEEQEDRSKKVRVLEFPEKMSLMK